MQEGSKLVRWERCMGLGQYGTLLEASKASERPPPGEGQEKVLWEVSRTREELKGSS